MRAAGFVHEANFMAKEIQECERLIANSQEPMAKGGIKLHGEGGGLVRALPPAKGLSEAPAECHPKGLGRFGLIRPM